MDGRRRQAPGNVVGDVAAADGDGIDVDQAAIEENGDGGGTAAHVDEGHAQVLLVLHQAG